MIRRAALFAFTISLVLPRGAHSADPLDMIKQAQAANKNVSYRGMKIATLYFAGRYMTSTLKVLHKKPDKTRTDFFTPDPIAGFIVIQDASNLWTYSPTLDTWEHKSMSEVDLPETLRPDLIRNFDIKLIGHDRVAGRPTYVIHAIPHNPEEAARRLWVDETCYLVIRMQVEDPHGAIVNSSRYTSIEFDPKDISPDSFRITGTVHSAPKPAPVEFKAVIPGYLPPGYRLFASTSITINGMSCAHMQFSNGSSVISLFERRGTSDADRPPTPVKSNVASVLTWSHDGMVFTLIGSIASKELAKIAGSMR